MKGSIPQCQKSRVSISNATLETHHLPSDMVSFLTPFSHFVWFFNFAINPILYRNLR